MDVDNCVLDISSDEETDVKDRQVNLEWFCNQIFKDVDDSDDVVFIGEVLSNNQIEGKCLSGGADVRNTDEKKGQEVDVDEDDCVVLDGDPDKMVSVEEIKDDCSDELVVVGEKGQVACRDYPHPRHLCVKFPFSSTLHKFHCELCHCYVCDTVAPCNLWGTGMSIADHCHATDKQEVWKTERKNFKLKRCSSLLHLKISENPSSSVPSTASTQTSNQPHPLTRSITMPSDHMAWCSMPSVPSVRSVLSPLAFRTVSSGSAVRPLPIEPSTNTPNIMNPRSGFYRLQQPPGGYTKYVSRRVRDQNTSVLGPQRVPFKRTRTGATYQGEFQSGYGQSHSLINSYAPFATQSQPIHGESVNREYRPHQWINSVSNMNNGMVPNPLPQSHYGNRPHTAAVYQGVRSNRTSSMSPQNASQQVTFPSVMIPDVSVPWVDSTNSFSSPWDQPLRANFASNHDTSNIWTDMTNTDSRQWDQPQPTEASSTPNTSTPRADNSNSSQLDQHLQPGTRGVRVPQSVNLQADHSEKGPLSSPESEDQTSTVPELEDLRFEFEDWLMENQSAVHNQSEPPFFSDQNILSPDDAHIDPVLLDEWSLLANVADI